MSERHRLELLRPGQIRAALALAPVVYMPLGTIEYHQEHLPVGLDALTAHGLCLGAAAALGGVVFPPLFHGTGGDHGDFPFTVMLDGPEPIEALLEPSLVRLEASGVRLAVLLSGHFAPEQVAMVERVAQRWNGRGTAMAVLGLALSMAREVALTPDHAGMFETTLLAAFWPDTVDVAALPARGDVEDPDNGSSPFGEQRLDPRHPLWGVFGPDPRDFTPAGCAPLRDVVQTWMNGRVSAALSAAITAAVGSAGERTVGVVSTGASPGLVAPT